MRLLPLPGVFQPISDSWMLAECMQRERVEPGVAVLDLCSGSGMLAVLAARRGAAATAVDISRRAMASARLNAALNGVKVETRRGDMFSAVPGRRFDVVVSNPPYVPSPEEALPRTGSARAWAAGRSGRVFVDRICREVVAHLRPGGVLLMVQNTLIGEAETLAALAGSDLEPDVALRHHGRLGPLMQTQADWLRRDGRLPADDYDEVIIVRARRRPEE